MSSRAFDIIGGLWVLGIPLSYPIILYWSWHQMPPKTYLEAFCCLFVTAFLSCCWPITLLLMFLIYLHTIPLR